MLETENIPGRTILIKGTEYLYFSGTSYLGIAKDKKFSHFLMEGLQKYGNNYSSSRISNLQLKVFEEAETYLATYTGAEAALTMSSGYMAGQIVVRMLEGAGEFIYAPKTHPALWRKPADFFVDDYTAWVNQLKGQIEKIPAQKIIILSNSLDPLLAEDYHFEWIKTLPDKKEFIVIIDDSHGFGITGKEGAGIFSQVHPPGHVELIVVSSMGKALGIPGGVVLSSRQTIEKLKESAFFGGSSPAVPAYLFAFLQANEVYKEARGKLIKNISQFVAGIQETRLFRFIPNYPVFYTSHNTLAAKLLNQNIVVSSFPYPSPADKLITRVIVNSLHTENDIRQLIANIQTYC